ncbi:hypothetical protein VOLCADRAFT_115903 [Volvox carteri f. nagariensis]|uniref:von Hippel-Lindau disease tumour suppressor beta domain-containing protein n=1 Tax=Volvox carteri f. nagariensis TaxID=3068 RepID=D8TIV5_VOLCA|nr:uncharacterized protein VOLCADRAFT_115903 [Volvox carteri f. nagariensis]EFJ52264.1 hypothetical protein VOLCADRAFT_115903 [Volvox carteri f. nagariensis]|eukprot:XP_002946337.1 hypothetical protein VOLCADRAFT_115903 [Volvox carteri f. nagariensis]
MTSHSSPLPLTALRAFANISPASGSSGPSAPAQTPGSPATPTRSAAALSPAARTFQPLRDGAAAANLFLPLLPLPPLPEEQQVADNHILGILPQLAGPIDNLPLGLAGGLPFPAAAAVAAADHDIAVDINQAPDINLMPALPADPDGEQAVAAAAAAAVAPAPRHLRPDAVPHIPPNLLNLQPPPPPPPQQQQQAGGQLQHQWHQWQELLQQVHQQMHHMQHQLQQAQQAHQQLQELHQEAQDALQQGAQNVLQQAVQQAVQELQAAAPLPPPAAAPIAPVAAAAAPPAAAPAAEQVPEAPPQPRDPETDLEPGVWLMKDVPAAEGESASATTAAAVAGGSSKAVASVEPKLSDPVMVFLRSLNSNQRTRVVFANESSRSVTAFWLNYGGQEVPYGALQPGQAKPKRVIITSPPPLQHTRETHAAFPADYKAASRALLLTYQRLQRPDLQAAALAAAEAQRTIANVMCRMFRNAICAVVLAAQPAMQAIGVCAPSTGDSPPSAADAANIRWLDGAAIGDAAADAAESDDGSSQVDRTPTCDRRVTPSSALASALLAAAAPTATGSRELQAPGLVQMRAQSPPNAEAAGTGVVASSTTPDRGPRLTHKGEQQCVAVNLYNLPARSGGKSKARVETEAEKSASRLGELLTELPRELHVALHPRGYPDIRPALLPSNPATWPPRPAAEQNAV